MSVDLGIAKLSQELEEFGLSRAGAKVYVALYAAGDSSARVLSKLTGVHRVEVYKKLDELMSLGFVSVKLGRPSIYQASEPRLLLDQMTQARIQGIKRLTEAKESLLSEFEDLRKSGKLVQREDEGSTYRLIIGRRKGFADSKKMVESAKTEILRVISSNDLIRNLEFGLLDSYRACAEAGIKIRLISDLSRVPKKIVRFCVDHLEVRHSPESAIRLLIVDRRLVLLSAVFNDSEMSLDSLEDRYIVVNDPNIGNAMALFFENLWSSSVPGRRLL